MTYTCHHPCGGVTTRELTAQAMCLEEMSPPVRWCHHPRLLMTYRLHLVQVTTRAVVWIEIGKYTFSRSRCSSHHPCGGVD